MRGEEKTQRIEGPTNKLKTFEKSSSSTFFGFQVFVRYMGVQALPILVKIYCC